MVIESNETRERGAEEIIQRGRRITGRELDVLRLVAEGYTNSMVAETIGVSRRTVTNHLSMIMAKLDAADRTHSVVLSIRAGILSV